MLCVLIRGDSNEYTQYIPSSIKRKSPIIISDLQLLDFFPRDSRTSSNSRVNEPSVFEPLKFYCCIIIIIVVITIVIICYLLLLLLLLLLFFLNAL